MKYLQRKHSLVLVIVAATTAQLAIGQNASSPATQSEADQPPPPQLPDPIGAKRISEKDRVWIDARSGEVLVDGYVSLQRGLLEMFACRANTKEHESIVALDARAFVIHTALLAIGAKPGTTAKFHPKFEPPTGTKIDILIRWQDKEKNWQAARAQDWIRDARTEKPMQEKWVFAGSGFWKNPETGEEHYMAEAGDVICVSNFSTAMLDIPIESTDADDGRLFEANPDAVPPLGTPVRLVLKPQLRKRGER